MVRAFHPAILAAKWLAVALGLAACAPGAMIDKLPGDMGLPAEAPARPVAPYLYPAVHDMPPARTSTPMNEDEQVTLERELRAARDRQEGQDGQARAAKKAAVVKKQQSSNPIIIPPAGAMTNP